MDRQVLRSHFPIWIVAVLSVAGILPATGQPLAIDTAKSTISVHVYKAGMLSAFGHDHEISARAASGSVDVEKHKVEMHVTAGALRVVDPKISDKDRDEIQKNMLGPEVLDTENHKEISFRSTSAETAGAGAWNVTGDLTLHGQTRPVSMEVRERSGHYTGTCRFKITDFGIKPVKAAGGTIRVKDEVQIEFDIHLAR